jgi:hypothetical protein
MHSADSAELLLAIVWGACFILVCFELWYWRKDLLHWTTLSSALLGSGIMISLAGWDELVFIAVLVLEYAAGALLAYSIARSRLFKLPPGLAALAAGVTCLALPLLPQLILGGQIPERSMIWFVGTIPALTLLFLPVGLITRIIATTFREHVAGSPPAAAPSPQERAKVLEMLGEGAISSEEAAELLDALGEDRRADAVPLGAGPTSALLGALGVTIGFVLPWGHVRMGGIEGYQAGYHIGFLGWLILVLGVLPAVLACIPALDSAVRQGMLRLVIVSVGVVLAGSLCASAVARGTVPGVGLWIVVLGFAVQIAGGLAQSRIFAPAREADEN